MERTHDTLRRVNVHHLPRALHLREGMLSNLCLVGGIQRLELFCLPSHAPPTLGGGLVIAGDGTAAVAQAETRQKPYSIEEETAEGQSQLEVCIYLYLKDIAKEQELLKWEKSAHTQAWLLNWYLLDALATTKPPLALPRQVGWRVVQAISPLVSVITSRRGFESNP